MIRVGVVMVRIKVGLKELEISPRLKSGRQEALEEPLTPILGVGEEVA